MIPPKISISDYMGMIKGRTAIRVLNKFKKLQQKPYWGRIFTVLPKPSMVICHGVENL